jgi:hypothetical protein
VTRKVESGLDQTHRHHHEHRHLHEVQDKDSQIEPQQLRMKHVAAALGRGM